MVIHTSVLFFILVCLIAVAALGWLIVVARRERADAWQYKLALGWLLPFFPVQFAIEYWQESARPFVLFMSSWLVAAVLLVVILVGGNDAQVVATPERLPAAGDAVPSAAAPVSAEPEPGSYAYLVQQARQMHEMGLFTDQQLEAELAALREEYGAGADAPEPEPAVPPVADTQDTAAEPAAEIVEDAAPADEDQAVEKSVAMSGVEPGPGKADVSAASPPSGTQDSGADSAPAAAPPAAPREKPARQEAKAPPQPTSSGREISYEEAVNYVGREMLVLTNNGVRHDVRLVNLQGRALVFERRVAGGAVSFELTRNDIRVIRLK